MAKPIIIQAPRQGIARSPHVGFSDIQNLNIDDVPGVVTLNNIMAKKSATTVTDQINWIVRHPVTTTEIYALGNTGKVYKSADSGATWALMTGFTAGGHGNGMIIWKNYLFVCRDAYIDVCGDGTATGITNANWTNGWKAIDSDVLWHPMIVSKNDNKIYGGAGKYVFSLDENSGQTFAPGTADTFTFTSQALDLPPDYRIKCLEELGSNLMIGTWQGANIYDIRVADIFVWDRASVSFGQPIILSDYGVHAMKNMGNSLVVLAGINGTVFRCDGVNAHIIGQLPHDLSGGKYMEWYPGGICNFKNKTFFSSGNGGTTAIEPQGVWSLLQTGQGNVLNLEHTISTGSTGSANPLKVTALLPVTRDTLMTGWRDNATYGIDLSTATSYTTSYGGYFVTPLYAVGETNHPEKFKCLEFTFSKPLVANQGIKIEYRVNLTDSFTEIGTWDYTTLGGILSKNIILDDPDEVLVAERIQFKVSLTGTTTTPYLQQIVIKE